MTVRAVSLGIQTLDGALWQSPPTTRNRRLATDFASRKSTASDAVEHGMLLAL